MNNRLLHLDGDKDLEMTSNLLGSTTTIVETPSPICNLLLSIRIEVRKMWCYLVVFVAIYAGIALQRIRKEVRVVRQSPMQSSVRCCVCRGRQYTLVLE